jgi:hypothetical protein
MNRTRAHSLRRAQVEKELRTAPALAPIPINSLRPQTPQNGFVFANDISAPSTGAFPIEKVKKAA